MKLIHQYKYHFIMSLILTFILLHAAKKYFETGEHLLNAAAIIATLSGQPEIAVPLEMTHAEVEVSKAIS